MAILEVSKDDNRQLQNIANSIAAAKKVVVVTGAGISTNCGIPVRKSGFRVELELIAIDRISVQKKDCTPLYKRKGRLPVQRGLLPHPRADRLCHHAVLQILR